MDDGAQKNHEKNDSNSVDKVTFTTPQNRDLITKRGNCSGQMELTVLRRRWTLKRSIMSVHICVLLACLILSCCASGSEADGNNNNNSNSTSTSAPIDIYLHKLGLMLSPAPKQGQQQQQEGRSLFDHVVNATSAELQDSHHDVSSPAIQANIVDSSGSASSFELKCEGLDCPTAQFLRHSSSSEFHPTVLPRWNTLLEKRKLLLVEGKQNISSPQIVQKRKLGPLRIFKYIHNPDELKNLGTTTSTTTVTTTTTTTAKTTTTPVPKVAVNNKRNGSMKSSQNEISQDEREQSVNTSAEVNSEERNDQYDRSLIPNSFFSSSGSKELVKASPSETKNIVVNGTNLDEADAFRSRRSPFRPHWRDHKLYPTGTKQQQHSREALYQMAPAAPPQSYAHPPPPGVASVPIAMSKHSPANPMIQHALVPISAHAMRPSSPIPFPSNQISVATDRNFVRNNNNNNYEGGPDAESPEEQGSFRMNSFKKPPNKRGRRPPPHRAGKRPPGSGPVPSVMPPPKPIPVPIPVPVPTPNNHRPHPHNHHHHHPPHNNHHNHHHHPRGSHSHVNHRPPPHGGPPPPNPQPLRAHPSIQYSYPKDAANIQDILSYFKTGENEIGDGPPLKNSQGSSIVPSLSGGGGISSEFRDVHSSLLKDIQNFAKRPSMMGKDNSRESSPGSSPGPKDSPSTLALLGPEDPLDDMLDPKEKPVRMMSTRTQNRQREEESYRHKGKSSSNNNHDRDRDAPYKEASTRHKYEDDDDDYNFEEIKPKKRPKGERHRGHRNPAHYEDDEETRDEEYHHNYDRKEKRTRNHHRKGHKADYDDRRELYDERPYANNIHADVYTRDGERERHRDYGADHHYSPKSSSSSSSRRPSSKSHRHHRHKSHRHKSKSNKYSDYHSNDKYRHHYSNYREREALGSRERETMRQAPQKVVHHQHAPPARQPSPPKFIQMTPMDQAYYQQRNRPVVIKRPYSPYRPVDVKKIEQRRKHHDKYWNSVDVVKVVDNKPTNNLVSPTYARPMTSSGSSTLPQPVQTHYHYYGIGASPGISTTVSQRMPLIPASTTRRPVRINPNDLNGSVEGEILEIHHADGGGPVGLPEISSTPIYTGSYSSGGTYNTHNSYPVEEHKKAHMHKMYMNYLQKKLEAEAEAQAEAMMNQPMMPNSIPNVIPHSMPTANPTTPKPTKRPMRMKIHIYPNEKVQVVDHSNANPQTVYYSNPNGAYAHPAPPPPTNIYSSSPSANVHRSYGHYETQSISANTVPPMIISNTPHHQAMTPHHHHQSIPPHPMSSVHNHHRNPSRSGQPPRSHPSTSSSASQGPTGDKNNNNSKNLVLHLHVHRRNDNLDSGQMEMAGSETVTSTVKPLTYE